PDVSACSPCRPTSKTPSPGPPGPGRGGRVARQPILFPTDEERKKGQLELIVAAHKTAVAMVEAGATGVSETQMYDAIRFGFEASQQICGMLDELREKSGSRPKLEVKPPPRDDATYEKIKSEA